MLRNTRFCNVVNRKTQFLIKRTRINSSLMQYKALSESILMDFSISLNRLMQKLRTRQNLHSHMLRFYATLGVSTIMNPVH